jgi:DNA repair ATPase RecN
MSEETFKLIDDDSFSLELAEPTTSHSEFASLNWDQLFQQAIKSEYNLAKWKFKFYRMHLAVQRQMNKLQNKMMEFTFHPFDLETIPDIIKISKACDKKYKDFEYWALLNAVEKIENEKNIFRAKYEVLAEIIKNHF